VSFGEVVLFALGALRGARRRSVLALLGTAIGVTAVILLTALGEGARRYVTAEFAGLGTNLVIVVPGKVETTGGMPGFGGAPNDLTLEDVQALQRALPRLKALAPIAIGNDTVSFRERQRQVAVIGATSDFAIARELVVRQGEFLPPGPLDRGAPVVVLGADLARELFLDQDPVGQVVRVGDWRMRVIGVLAPKGMHLGLDMDEIALVPVATGMKMFDESSLFRILMKAPTPADVEPTERRALAVLIERHDEEDVTLITQDAVSGAFSAILTVLTAALAGIAAISLAVAGIGIMNVMLVSVAERRAEIGLLKALGARSAQVLRVFLVEAMLLAGAGALAGLAAGFLGSEVLAHLLSGFDARPPPWAVLAAVATALGTGALFGLLPAWRATRVDPVEALARR
jgi:putative ABC transport system permease protein